MNIAEHMEQYGHEQFAAYVDREVGLKAFIAIHDTTLGPALGGCRIWPHKSEEDAINDVLRLSRAMTYKNAAAGLHLGGGKALIWADPRNDKSEGLLRAFGRFVDSQGGRYITCEDVGSTLEDVVIIRQETSHVVGLPTTFGGSGDSSEATGLGIYQGIRACAKEAFGTDDLKGMRVAVQGFGKVAWYLSQHLKSAKAQVVVTDINRDALRRAAEMELEVVEDPETIFDVPCEVFSPCALGGVLNGDTIPRLQCKVVAGGANNQLLTDEDGDLLHQKGILYAPDYVINAGGVINLSYEVRGPYRKEAAIEQVEKLYDAVAKVISIAKEEEITTAKAANRLAEERIRLVRKTKPIYLARNR